MIVAAIADRCVPERVAVAVDIGLSEQGEIFDKVAEAEVGRESPGGQVKPPGLYPWP